MAFYHFYPRTPSCPTYRSNFTFNVFSIWLLCKVSGGECCLNVKFDNNSVKARPSVSKNLVSRGVLIYALSCQTSRCVTGTACFLARAQTNETNTFAMSAKRRADMFQGRYENLIYEILYRCTHEWYDTHFSTFLQFVHTLPHSCLAWSLHLDASRPRRWIPSVMSVKKTVSLFIRSLYISTLLHLFRLNLIW